MSLDITVDHAHRLILMRGSGVLTDADLAAAHDQFEANAAADPSFGRICDLSALTGVQVSDKSLDRWVTDSVSNPPVRHAIVCNTPPVLKRVLDYVRLSRKQFREVSVFPSYEQAADWMGREHKSP
jgi:hypothetical protein